MSAAMKEGRRTCLAKTYGTYCPALKMAMPGLHNVDAAIRSILQRLFALLAPDFATHLQSKNGSA